MSILDKAKAAAERARGQARQGVAQGRARLMQMQWQRQHSKLERQLGEACFAEHSREGTHEPVTRALAALDAHAQAHPQALAPAGPRAARQARDIMHLGVECIGEGDSVAAAAQKMRDLGVGSLPICGADDRLHGIVTDRDIVMRCIAEGRDPAQVRAGDLAQETLFWVEAAADVGEVLRQMEDHRIKRLPVIENHRLVGIITEADLARNVDEHRLAEFVEKVYATALRPARAHPRPPGACRRAGRLGRPSAIPGRPSLLGLCRAEASSPGRATMPTYISLIKLAWFPTWFEQWLSLLRQVGAGCRGRESGLLTGLS